MFHSMCVEGEREKFHSATLRPQKILIECVCFCGWGWGWVQPNYAQNSTIKASFSCFF